MDQRTYHQRSSWLAFGKSTIAALVLAGGLSTAADAQVAEQVTAADSEQARQNLALFDQLDFEAWNNRDWDLFRQLHTDDVHVEGFGQATDGIEAHLAWAQAFLTQVPDSTIVAHPIRIGAGDWIAVTGVSNDGSTSATFARWENGQIAEEYLFSLMSGPADTASGTPTA